MSKTPIERALELVDLLMDERMSPSARSVLKLLSEEIITAKMDEVRRQKNAKA